MRYSQAMKYFAGFALLAVPGVALAQAAPMAEVIGQPIQATTNGVTNTLYFDADGTVRITTPKGSVVQGNWSVQQNNLCVSQGGASECWPYNNPFEAQQPRSMTSSCNSVSTWTAQNTNDAERRGKAERGN